MTLCNESNESSCYVIHVRWTWDLYDIGLYAGVLLGSIQNYQHFKCQLGSISIQYFDTKHCDERVVSLLLACKPLTYLIEVTIQLVKYIGVTKTFLNRLTSLTKSFPINCQTMFSTICFNDNESCELTIATWGLISSL